MPVIAIVSDSLGNRLTPGPILTATGVSVKRVLDGAGSFQCSFPIRDARAVSGIENERQIELQFVRGTQKRVLGRGVIRNVTMEGRGESSMLKISGPDSLDTLSRFLVGRWSSYENQTVKTIADALILLCPGWTVSVETALLTARQTARFGGSNLLRAFKRMTQEGGFHLREGLVRNQIELGVLGESSGVVLTNIHNATDLVYQKRRVIPITSLTQVRNSKMIATRVRPLGAGEGQAALDLSLSTRTSPYLIQTLGTGLKQEYYLRDAAAELKYGVIERYLTFKEIGPLTNSLTSQGYAANQLYDAAAAWLTRNKEPIQSYQVQGLNSVEAIRPGSKVKIVYSGYVYDDFGNQFRYIDLNNDFWVTGITEKVSGEQLTYDLDISSIDEVPQDPKQVLVDTIDAINVRNVNITTYPFMYENCYTRFIEAQEPTLNPVGTQAVFRLRFTTQVTKVTSVLLRFRTFPLNTSLSVSLNGVPVSQTVTPAAGVLHTHTMPNTPIVATFNMTEDTQYPTGITLAINGVDVTSALGGPWAPTNTQVDISLDISDYIRNAVGGFQKAHDIVFSCAQRNGNTATPFSAINPINQLIASHGYIEANFTVQGVCQGTV